ncbi:MAG: hypothetical protein IJ747_07330 [Lachnospiraceae bacterium]|nr:hypothetical protein [Lachnospiraceae bacterium]
MEENGEVTDEMASNNSLKNCRIVIRDVETEQTIADTMILTHTEETEQITIETDSDALQEGLTVSALIFSATGLYESHGVVASRSGNQTVITLYEGMAQNDRHAVRYQVNIQGKVDSINRPAVGKIAEEFEIVVLNMSAIGILIQAPKGKIQEKDTIHFSANAKGQRIAITAVAMRVETEEADREKIGCSVQLVNLG